MPPSPQGTQNRFCRVAFILGTLFILTVIPVTGHGKTRIPDTGQTRCFSDTGILPACPDANARYFGQDAQFQGHAMSYQDNGDGTVTDRVTGLMWSRAVDARKVSLDDAQAMARNLALGGHRDWRVPNIKELYSLINFSGSTMGPGQQGGANTAIPYINTDYFNFKYGDTRAGERYIDAQWLSSTTYVSYTMDRNPTLFGVNFADGRIKGYGYAGRGPRGEKKFYVRFVRGTPYGANDFHDNGNGTVTDRATGLMWSQADSQTPMTWAEALAFANASRLGGHRDWRLPNAKELQYIVDYTRSPDTTDSAAIDPVFSVTQVTNEAGQKDFGHYWTATTHMDGPRPDSAVTVCFGRAMGQMRGRIMDVHGAGAQRSDPKTGSNSIGRGPQGDARHGRNHVRLVRGGEAALKIQPAPQDRSAYPFVVKIDPGYEAIGSGNQTMGPGRSGGQMGSGPMGSNQMGGGQTGGRRFVARLDRDGDGQVSSDEFDGPPQHFERLDRNGDGFISADEAPAGPPPGNGPPRMSNN